MLQPSFHLFLGRLLAAGFSFSALKHIVPASKEMDMNFNGSGPQRLASAMSEIFRDAVGAAVDLYKVMIPIVIAVKLLQELDVIRYLALPLKPVMGLVGLPDELGLVWATALINNIYSGLIVLFSLAKDTPITTAQATVLGAMMLVAHGLPVELRIARAAGPRFAFQCVLRVAGALLFGWMLYRIFQSFDWLQGPANFPLDVSREPADSGWIAWGVGEARNLAAIFVIITALVALMRLLKAARITDAMNWLLRPVLRLMGVGPKASTITVIGLTMGLAYGGGLIIHEAKNGGVSRRDVFYSVSLMGLCHSLVEDTLLVAMAGADLSWILWGRLAFALVGVALVAAVSRRLPEPLGDRWLWGPAQDAIRTAEEPA